LASALVPLYISEISPAAIRGTLGSVNQFSICIGILGALCVNVWLPVSEWRSMMMLSAIPAALLGVGMLFMPESPRWLWTQTKSEEAKKAAVTLWGSEEELMNSSRGGAEAVPGESSSGGSLLELFRDKRYTKATTMGGMLFLIQQFGGINAIIYFSSSVFKQAGVASASTASAAVGLVNVGGTILAGALMDKAGRKQLLGGSLIGMGLSMVLLAASMTLPVLRPFASPIALVGTLLYVLSFACGAGPCPGLLSSEIFPARVRGSGVAWCMLVHWTSNFMIGQFFLATVTAVGVPAVYMAFATVCLLGSLYVQKAVIETKGKSLEEIEAAMLA